MCLVPRIPPKNGCCFMFCTCTHSPKCHAFRSYTCRVKSMQNPTIIPSCSLVPIPMWAHYVAHVAIYTPSHKKYKRSHVQLTWFWVGLTEKLYWPETPWPTFGYTMKLHHLRAAYLKTEMKWRNERWMIPFFSFSSYSKWQITWLVAVTDSWNDSKLINGGPIK